MITYFDLSENSGVKQIILTPQLIGMTLEVQRIASDNSVLAYHLIKVRTKCSLEEYDALYPVGKRTSLQLECETNKYEKAIQPWQDFTCVQISRSQIREKKQTKCNASSTWGDCHPIPFFSSIKIKFAKILTWQCKDMIEFIDEKTATFDFIL